MQKISLWEYVQTNFHGNPSPPQTCPGCCPLRVEMEKGKIETKTIFNKSLRDSIPALEVPGFRFY